MNLNGSVLQRKTSPRRGLEFLDLPSNFYVNDYFNTSVSYDYSPASTYTFSSKVSNVVPVVQEALTSAKLLYPTFNNRNLFNTLAVLTYWEESFPEKKYFIRAALTLTGDIIFELEPLQPDTKYIFQVFQGNTLLSSGNFSTLKESVVAVQEEEIKIEEEDISSLLAEQEEQDIDSERVQTLEEQELGEAKEEIAESEEVEEV